MFGTSTARYLSLIILLCIGMNGLAERDQFSVRDFGAVGDGKTDDTPAFQKALDEAGKAGGGIVAVSIGNYLIASHLNIPNEVTLEGVWSIPTAWTQMHGSTLLAVEGIGSEEGPPFITLNANSTIKGITVFYPDQKPEDIKPYPPCVACNNGDNASIVDCLLVNPYYAVDFATQRSGRHYIRNLYGQPLKRGITISQCYDVGRIENVHFWPFWTWDTKTGIRKWMWENGEAFVFGRTDWQYVFNTFCFGYKVGYRFTGTEHGVCNGNFLGIGADASVNAIVIDKCSPNGLLITNGEFVAFATQDPISLVVGKENEGVLQFANCAFWGPSSQIARIEGTGSVTFQGCNFRDYDRLSMGRPAIELLGGHLMVSNSLFTRPSPQLIVGEGASSAIVMGNRFAGPQCIQWPDGAAVQIGFNVENSDGLELKVPPPVTSRTEEPGAIMVTVDLRKDHGKWNQLGDFPFMKGQSGAVIVSNEADGNVMADAVKFVPRGENKD